MCSDVCGEVCEGRTTCGDVCWCVVVCGEVCEVCSGVCGEVCVARCVRGGGHVEMCVVVCVCGGVCEGRMSFLDVRMTEVEGRGGYCPP